MTNHINQIQNNLKENLISFNLSNSFGHRAVGDKIESDCAKLMKRLFQDSYSEPKSKRSIEDFTIRSGNHTNYFDVKTHFIQDDGFSMPNLISVKRLKKLLENDNNSLFYIFVDYTRDHGMVHIQNVLVKSIWELDWSILGIGALGKGQLQIKNANNDLVFTKIGKDEWFKTLKLRVKDFYKKELSKIEKEIVLWD